MKKYTKSWIAEAGKYTTQIGASSQNLKLTNCFTVENEITVEKCNKVLVPNVIISELKK